MTKLKKLKRAVIKEELVILTGDFKYAVVLNQMIYWSERVKDADKFVQDEIKRSHMAMNSEEREYADRLNELDLLSHGWIYKSAEELSEETMMGVSKSTMGRYLDHLVTKGWLDKRKNPKWKGDRTFQYRVNLVKIQMDLQLLGYSLEGYSLIDLTKFQNETTKSHDETSRFQNEIYSSKIEQYVSKQNNITRDYSEITSQTLEEEEEEEQASLVKSDLVKFLMDKEIQEENALAFEAGLLREGITGYTHEQALEAIERSLIDFGKGKCEQPYIWAAGKLKFILEAAKKSKQDDPEPRKGKGKAKQPYSKQPIRKEVLPDWYKENQEEEQEPKKEIEQEREKMNEVLEKLKKLSEIRP